MNAIVLENQMELLASYMQTHKKILIVAATVLFMIMLATLAHATSTDAWANSGYDFVMAAAQGKFARSICVVGGLVGLMMGAGSGKPILALGGVVLAAFGFLAPTLINAIFGGALI